MFTPKMTREFAQNMAKEFFDSLPPQLTIMRKEMENGLNQFLQSCFDKMDLVTREEFDIQMKVLVKTRAKLEELEAQLLRG